VLGWAGKQPSGEQTTADKEATVTILGRFIMLSALTVLMLQGACTFRGTTDWTSDTTNDITISTSGETFGDGARLQHFTTRSYPNLQQDMARANGEYLDSFATLMGVSTEQRPAFAQYLQQRQSVWNDPAVTPTKFLETVRADWRP
jgi:hypothetical protein